MSRWTTVRVSKEVAERIRVLAAGGSLAGYIDDLTRRELDGGTPVGSGSGEGVVKLEASPVAEAVQEGFESPAPGQKED